MATSPTNDDRIEAYRINREAGATDDNPEPAITADQVASNRRLNERLTNAFGFGQKTPPTKVAPVAVEDTGPAPSQTRSESTSPSPAATTVSTASTESSNDLNVLLGDNPIYSLSDFSYSFILIALTPSQWNDIAKNPKSVQINQNVIIASGSRNNSQLKRNDEFISDFYISDLKFDTVVGLNSRTKGSNAISINFKIIEPMGASFFERLYTMTSKLGIKNYLEIPYLLIIEFRGNTDEGKPNVLADHTKYIPLKLIRSDMRLTASGSEYNVDAIPFNHIAYNTTEYGSTKVNITVTAKTVGDFFANSGDANELLQQIESADQRLSDEIRATGFGAFVSGTREEATNDINRRIEQAKKTQYNVKSFTQAINAFQAYARKNRKTAQVDDYRFEIDPSIASFSIVDPNFNPSNTKNTAPGSPKDGQFPINAGTSIIDVINIVMKNSDYIKNQIGTARVDLSKNAIEIANTLGRPLQWYKIIPSITIKEYDVQRNTYARTITYTVVPYKVYNTKSSLAPKSFPSKWLNQYDYIFTGNNQGILDIDLRFEIMFFQLATVNRDQWDPWNSAPKVIDERDFATSNAAADSFAPLRQIPVATNLVAVTSAPTPTVGDIAVSDLYSHLLSNMRGELINLRLKIIGDPRYIKQDDLFYNSKNTINLPQQLITTNNSIVFDFEERYVKINFLTPLDYNDSGLLDNKDRYRASKFSGVYRILTIENVFSRGKFEQTLELIRLFDQPGDSTVSSRPISEFERSLIAEANISILGDEERGPNRGIDQRTTFTTPVPEQNLTPIIFSSPDISQTSSRVQTIINTPNNAVSREDSADR